MSSMIVFGTKQECIKKDTVPHPDNFYGDSKLKADIGIHNLEDGNFKVVSVRPPMIYGKGSKGNYPLLAKFAKRTPVFPCYHNKRSMLYIENLCEFVKRIIGNNETGFFYPQNSEYTETYKMVGEIAEVSGKKIVFVKLFNPLIKVCKGHPVIKKVFGNMYYDRLLSDYDDNSWCVVDLKESIKRTEN